MEGAVVGSLIPRVHGLQFGHARIHEQNIQSSQLPLHCLSQNPLTGGIGGIGRDVQQRIPEFLTGRLKGFGLAGRDCPLRALGSKLPRRFQADPARSSRNECPLPFESIHVLPSLSLMMPSTASRPYFVPTSVCEREHFSGPTWRCS